ncbi:hypothetical protein PSPO01_13276 [Paraphaeosphaeria sporulosa]
MLRLSKPKPMENKEPTSRPTSQYVLDHTPIEDTFVLLKKCRGIAARLRKYRVSITRKVISKRKHMLDNQDTH